MNFGLLDLLALLLLLDCFNPFLGERKLAEVQVLWRYLRGFALFRRLGCVILHLNLAYLSCFLLFFQEAFRQVGSHSVKPLGVTHKIGLFYAMFTVLGVLYNVDSSGYITRTHIVALGTEFRYIRIVLRPC